jgi:hypothetical protein
MPLRTPPDAQWLLTEVDWAALPHGDPGQARDTPEILAALLDDSPAVRTAAVADLSGLLTRQDYVYSATAPAAVYVARILSDERCLEVGPYFHSGYSHPGGAAPRPLRQALLEWLCSVAGVVNCPDYLAAGEPVNVTACRAVCPLADHLVSAFLPDSDPGIAREALCTSLTLRKPPHLAEAIPHTGYWLQRVIDRSGIRHDLIMKTLTRRGWDAVMPHRTA